MPHITVGNLSDTDELDVVYESVKEIDTTFKCRVTNISVEMIGKNEESIIVIEKQLN